MKTDVDRQTTVASENGATAPDYPLLPAVRRIEEGERLLLAAAHNDFMAARHHLQATHNRIAARHGVTPNEVIVTETGAIEQAPPEPGA